MCALKRAYAWGPIPLALPKGGAILRWVYPHSADVLREARLKTVAEYIAKRRHTVMRSIADRPILEECRGGGKAAWEPSPP